MLFAPQPCSQPIDAPDPRRRKNGRLEPSDQRWHKWYVYISRLLLVYILNIWYPGGRDGLLFVIVLGCCCGSSGSVGMLGMYNMVRNSWPILQWTQTTSNKQIKPWWGWDCFVWLSCIFWSQWFCECWASCATCWLYRGLPRPTSRWKGSMQGLFWGKPNS